MTTATDMTTMIIRIERQAVCPVAVQRLAVAARFIGNFAVALVSVALLGEGVEH